jgi:hypothetical protein
MLVARKPDEKHPKIVRYGGAGLNRTAGQSLADPGLFHLATAPSSLSPNPGGYLAQLFAARKNRYLLPLASTTKFEVVIRFGQFTV